MSNKDWTGNNRSVYGTLGASNHTDKEREENDYYATSPKAVEMLLEQETFSEKIWECASGEDHIAKVLRKHGHAVRCTDIIDRTGHTIVENFLTSPVEWFGDIITNPPYKYAQEFVEKSIDLIEDGNKVAMLLRLQFLEGKKRKELFKKYPPKYVYVFSGRINCAKNGDFITYNSSALSYAWFVWEKGYKGDPIIKRID